MPKFEPLDIPAGFQADDCEASEIRWDTAGFDVLFVKPSNSLLRMRADFELECIIRIQSEFALSTEEEEGETEGIVPLHLAYRVQGGKFLKSQSAAWIQAHQPKHYLFITPGACIDVLSAAEPKFKIVMPRAGLG